MIQIVHCFFSLLRDNSDPGAGFSSEISSTGVLLILISSVWESDSSLSTGKAEGLRQVVAITNSRKAGQLTVSGNDRQWYMYKQKRNALLHIYRINAKWFTKRKQ